MEKKDIGMVKICRSPRDIEEPGVYEAAKIKNVEWGDTSGGAHVQTGHYSLYGYAPYGEVKDLVVCSGTHDFGGNYARICIHDRHNREEPYLTAYKQLEAQAGGRPISKIAENRPNGAPPCTKKILSILEKKSSVSRKELRDELKDIGYEGTTIASAIKRLTKKGLIKTMGAPQSPNQIIKSGNAHDFMF